MGNLVWILPLAIWTAYMICGMLSTATHLYKGDSLGDATVGIVFALAPWWFIMFLFSLRGAY